MQFCKCRLSCSPKGKFVRIGNVPTSASAVAVRCCGSRPGQGREIEGNTRRDDEHWIVRIELQYSRYGQQEQHAKRVGPACARIQLRGLSSVRRCWQWSGSKLSVIVGWARWRSERLFSTQTSRAVTHNANSVFPYPVFRRLIQQDLALCAVKDACSHG